MLQTLLECFHAATGRRDLPVIGIIDWHEVPTQSEFQAFKEWFESLGFTCVIADPRELEYSGGKLRAGGTVIDLIYKRVLIHELVEREGMEHPMVRAVRDRAVCMVNPFRCKVLHKKASLAVLSDERNAALFDAPMRKAIARPHSVDAGGGGANDDLAGARTWTCWTMSRGTARSSCSSRTTTTAARGSCWAGRWMMPPGAGRWRPLASRRRSCRSGSTSRASCFRRWIDGKLLVSDRIVDTAPYVFGGSMWTAA